MANETSYDVVIVGAGIAGAQMAYKLAKQSKKVLVLEAGPYIPNVGQQFPVKQNNIDKYYGAAVKDPSAPWPTPKDPKVSFADSKIYAPRPTSPGVNSDNSGIVPDQGKTPGWKDPQGNFMQQTGAYGFGSTYERVAGGTTKHWLGTCLRFVPDDFKVVSKYNPPVPGASDWPIGYDDLETYYGQAENEIGVSGDPTVDDAMGAKHSTPYPMTPVPQSYLDQTLKTRFAGFKIDGQALNVVSTPQGRNTKVYDGRPACMGNSSCVPICPINAKYDAGVHIDRILKSPNQNEPVDLNQFVTFMWQTVATQVTTNADDSISGIVYKTWSNDTPGKFTDGVATGTIYVVAAHAIETAKLLLNSPWKGKTVANSSDMVGRHLMDHICNVVWGNLLGADGKTFEPVYPYRGPLSTSGIESFRNTAERSKTAAFRIEIGNDGWSWPYGGPQHNVSQYNAIQADGTIKNVLIGKDLLSAVQTEAQSAVRFALELETISGDETMESRVTLSSDKDAMGIPRPSVSYKLPQYTLDGYARTIDVANQLMTGGKIKNQTQLLGGSGTMSFIPTGGTKPVNIEFRGAGHLIGTHRMGTNPKNSVTNGDLLSWDHSNLYLVGAGAFPSTATSNPTLTISALALRAASTINSRLTA